MSSLTIYISSQAEDRNIKSEQQVNLILKGFYRWVLSWWCHCLVITWFWQISLSLGTEVLLLSNLGSKKNSLIEAHGTLLHWGVISLPFDQVILINLYISSYSKTIRATFIHANVETIINFLIQIVCNKKDSASFAKKTDTLVVVDLFAGSCICTWNKLIKANTISPLTFFFKFFFWYEHLIQKQHTGIVLSKKVVPKTFEMLTKQHMCWSLFLIKL